MLRSPVRSAKRSSSAGIANATAMAGMFNAFMDGGLVVDEASSNLSLSEKLITSPYLSNFS